MINLYEIYVPTQFNDGTPIRTRYHKIWDQKVYSVTSGLTIHSPVKGIWISPTGTKFAERMIPVRIVCTRAQIETIIDITMEYYKQEAILAYKLSDEVILKHKMNENTR